MQQLDRPEVNFGKGDFAYEKEQVRPGEYRSN